MDNKVYRQNDFPILIQLELERIAKLLNRERLMSRHILSWIVLIKTYGEYTEEIQLEFFCLLFGNHERV